MLEKKIYYCVYCGKKHVFEFNFELATELYIPECDCGEEQRMINP